MNDFINYIRNSNIQEKTWEENHNSSFKSKTNPEPRRKNLRRSQNKRKFKISNSSSKQRRARNKRLNASRVKARSQDLAKFGKKNMERFSTHHRYAKTPKQSRKGKSHTLQYIEKLNQAFAYKHSRKRFHTDMNSSSQTRHRRNIKELFVNSKNSLKSSTRVGNVGELEIIKPDQIERTPEKKGFIFKKKKINFKKKIEKKKFEVTGRNLKNRIKFQGRRNNRKNGMVIKINGQTPLDLQRKRVVITINGKKELPTLNLKHQKKIKMNEQKDSEDFSKWRLRKIRRERLESIKFDFTDDYEDVSPSRMERDQGLKLLMTKEDTIDAFHSEFDDLLW